MNEHPPARGHRVLWTLLTLVAVAAIALWAWKHFSDASKPKGGKPPPVAITSTRVTTQDVPLYRSGIGTVTAALSVTVKPRVDGQLESVGFTEGQDVKAGQLLAQIDPRTLEAQLEQSQAQKARDEAQLANARIDLQRYSSLIAQDAATPQQVDTQKAQVAQLSAAVKTDDAQIHFAQVQLGFTRITAPISGRVGARLADPGNIVHAADATGIVVINQVDPITAVFTLPEDAFQDINRAQQASHRPLKVTAFSRDGNQALGTGELILVNNQIDTATGTVSLKARFANPAHTLWPGQYVNMRLTLGEHAQALTVPAAVVQRGQDGLYAYVVKDDNTVVSQPIEVAQIQDNLAVVTKGLAANQRVVLDGQYKLRPGSAVVESKQADKTQNETPNKTPSVAGGAASAAPTGRSS